MSEAEIDDYDEDALRKSVRVMMKPIFKHLSQSTLGQMHSELVVQHRIALDDDDNDLGDIKIVIQIEGCMEAIYWQKVRNEYAKRDKAVSS